MQCWYGLFCGLLGSQRLLSIVQLYWPAPRASAIRVAWGRAVCHPRSAESGLERLCCRELLVQLVGDLQCNLDYAVRGEDGDRRDRFAFAVNVCFHHAIRQPDSDGHSSRIAVSDRNCLPDCHGLPLCDWQRSPVRISDAEIAQPKLELLRHADTVSHSVWVTVWHRDAHAVRFDDDNTQHDGIHRIYADAFP